VLVEEVDVLDECEAARLPRCEEEAHERSEAVVAGKIGVQRCAQCKERADETSPEEDGGAAPARYKGDPEDTPDTAVRMVSRFQESKCFEITYIMRTARLVA